MMFVVAGGGGGGCGWRFQPHPVVMKTKAFPGTLCIHQSLYHRVAGENGNHWPQLLLVGRVAVELARYHYCGDISFCHLAAEIS